MKIASEYERMQQAKKAAGVDPTPKTKAMTSNALPSRRARRTASTLAV